VSGQGVRVHVGVRVTRTVFVSSYQVMRIKWSAGLFVTIMYRDPVSLFLCENYTLSLALSHQGSEFSES
jgi:hypothetical protein